MQSFTVVALLVSSLALSQAKPNVGLRKTQYTPRVVNGEEAILAQFAYQATLQLRGFFDTGHFCGGTILAENIILTAAHCVTDVSIPNLTYIEIRAGIVNLEVEGPSSQSSRVLETIVHPDFKGGASPNDIAIHILSKPYTLNKYVEAVRLPQPGSIPSGKAVLSGWGSTSDTLNASLSMTLKYDELELISFEDCYQVWGNNPLNQTNVCTGVPSHVGACSGDSGSPLVQNGTIVGIASWGFTPCGYLPSVYTRVSAFNDFIEEQLARARTLLPK